MSILPQPRRQQTHVLVLEDEVEFRRVLLELLADEGFEVSTCDSYASLRDAVRGYDSPIVLADFWGTSHTELSARERDEIREMGQQARTILLTGRAWAASTDATDLDVVCILCKPVALDEIIEQIRRCVNQAAEG